MAGEQTQTTTTTTGSAGGTAAGSSSTTTAADQQNATSTTTQPAAGTTGTSTTTATETKAAGDTNLLGGTEQKTDAKTDAQKTDAQKAADTKVAEQPKPLELKPPDGFSADAPLFKQFAELATKTGLKSEQAQAVLELYAGDLKRELQAQAAETTKQNESWVAELRKDREVGGDKFEASVRLANVGLEAINKNLIGVFKSAGLSNHPEVFRAMVKVGQLVSEDRISGTTNSSGPAAPADPYERIATGLYTHPNSRAS